MVSKIGVNILAKDLVILWGALTTSEMIGFKGISSRWILGNPYIH